MTLHTLDKIEQRSDAWYEQRRGIVTASTIGNLIATRKLSAIDYTCPECGARPNDPCLGKRTPTPIKTLHPERAAVARSHASVTVIEPASNDKSRWLTELLVAERITGRVEPTPISDAMWRGIEGEPFARDAYAKHYAPVYEVGFLVRDDWRFRIGCSPDGLVGSDGAIEIKTRSPKVQVRTVLADTVPAEVMPQLQCALLVSGRKWIDYVSFSPGMALWVKRVTPDPVWQTALVDAVRAFERNAAEMQRLYAESVAGLPMTEYHTGDIEFGDAA